MITLLYKYFYLNTYLKVKPDWFNLSGAG